MSDIRTFAAGAGVAGGAGGESSGALKTTSVKTSAYTATANQLVRANATSGAFAVTLPSAAAVGYGAVVVVKKTDATSNPVTVARAGSDTINLTGTSASLSLQDEALTFTSDGVSSWTISSGQKSLASLDLRYPKKADLSVNVKDFGALGDGVTNDSAAFTAALAAAGITRAVRVPAGTYVVTPGTISLAAGQVLIGESSSTTTIISSSGSKTGIGIILAARSTVSGLFVRGYYAGIDSRDNTVKILECQLSYNEIGIDFSAAAYLIRVRGNQITFNDVGIVVRPAAEAYELVISENIIDNNAGVGIAMDANSGGVVIENNSIEGNRNYTTGVGCGLLIKGTNLSRMKIDGNWFENNGDHATTAVDIFMLSPVGEPATGVALRAAILAVMPADLQSLFATGGANIGAVSITSNSFIFTKYNIVASGYKASISISRNTFKGIKGKFNKHIFLNIRSGTGGMSGGRIVIENNNANNSDDATIDPQVSSGINNTIVYSDSTLTGTTDSYVYNGKDLFYTAAGDGQYDVRISGVVGDGTTDDSAALAAAVALCSGASKRTLYIPPQLNVLISSQVNAQLVRRIDCQGTITVGYTGGAGLIIGDTSSGRNGCWYYFKRVVWAGSQSNVALRVVGLKSGRVTVEYCDYMQLYADSADATINSIAYSEFFLGRVIKLELYGAAGTSWINENNFYGGSVDNLIINAVTYGHNSNTWHGCSVEGASSTIQILVGSCNRVDARGESGPSVTFGSGTFANQVVGHFVSSAGVHSTPFVLVSDGGSENILTSAIDEKMGHYELLKIDSASVFFDGSSEWKTSATPVPGLDKLRTRSSSGQVIDTGIVPIRGAYALDGGTNYYRNWALTKLVFDSDTTLWRPQIYGYDSSGAAIDPTVTPWMATTGGWTANAGGYYSFGANQQFAQMLITSASVAFIRITVASSGSTGDAFGWVRLMGYVPTPQPDTAVRQIRRSLTQPLYQAAAPTQGAGKLGQSVASSAGGFTVVARSDTTLSVGASNTDTTITVASISGIASGDLIGVLLDSGQTHWTTVSGAPSGSVVTLAAALTGAAAIGRAVVTNRWSTPGAPDVQTFTADGTWTKPAGAKTVQVEMVAGGGGGGSGARRATGVLATGGGGGGGGGMVNWTFDASVISSTVAVTVGQGGAGGAAVTADDTNGNAGSNGTSSIFGVYARAWHGIGGGAGTSTASGAGGSGNLGTSLGGTGASSSSTGSTNSNAVLASGAPGGGAGGGITTGNVPANGSSGQSTWASPAGAAQGIGGTVDSTAPTAAGSVTTGYPLPGGSGGGGAASITTAAQSAAASGNYGAGGAGGGASRNGNNSGAGAVGAPGIVRVVTYF